MTEIDSLTEKFCSGTTFNFKLPKRPSNHRKQPEHLQLNYGPSPWIPDEPKYLCVASLFRPSSQPPQLLSQHFPKTCFEEFPPRPFREGKQHLSRNLSKVTDITHSIRRKGAARSAWSDDSRKIPATVCNLETFSLKVLRDLTNLTSNSHARAAKTLFTNTRCATRCVACCDCCCQMQPRGVRTH